MSGRALAFSVGTPAEHQFLHDAHGDHHNRRSKAMAQPPGSPEDLGRQTSLPWTPGEGGESLMQAIQALETYKKKDPSKGPFNAFGSSRVLTRPLFDNAGAVDGVQWSCVSRLLAMLRS